MLETLNSINKNYIKSAVCNDVDSNFFIYRELILDGISESYNLPDLINNLETYLQIVKELKSFIDYDKDPES